MKNVDYREEFYLKIFYRFPLGFDILHTVTITKKQTSFRNDDYVSILD